MNDIDGHLLDELFKPLCEHISVHRGVSYLYFSNEEDYKKGLVLCLINSIKVDTSHISSQEFCMRIEHKQTLGRYDYYSSD